MSGPFPVLESLTHKYRLMGLFLVLALLLCWACGAGSGGVLR